METSGQRVKRVAFRERNSEISQVTECSLHSRIANSECLFISID